MNYEQLGPFDEVSRLTLGGGGLGELWGETSEEEAIATIHAALDAGINLIDTAPIYNNCEKVIGECFDGELPDGVRITTKCMLGKVKKEEVAAKIMESLDSSLEVMRLDYVDTLFLHSNIYEDANDYRIPEEKFAGFATPWDIYVDHVVPTLERLVDAGRIGSWGITATGVPSTILKAIDHDVKPAIIQAVANLLDSAGSMRAYNERANPRQIIEAASERGIGVMGIRAVQAGALTDEIDRPLSENHPEVRDFNKARPFRQLCRELDQSPAALAHRYALDIPGVDTVVLGVKNQDELEECLEAEAAGPLPPELRDQIDELGLRDGD